MSTPRRDQLVERLAIAFVQHELEQAGVAKGSPKWVAAGELPDLALAHFGSLARRALDVLEPDLALATS